METRRSDSYDDSGVDPEKFAHLRHGPSISISRAATTKPERTDDNVTALPVEFPASIPYDSVQPAPYSPQPAAPTRRPFLTRVKTEYILLSKKKKIAILVSIVALLVLIIGLAAGLSTRSHRSSNLPLPSNHGGPYTGDLTYYAPALGSCGVTSSSSDSIVAVSHLLYDAVSTGSNPNANPLCGKKIRARRNGRSVDLTVVDRCTGCKATDLDVTESVFKELAEIDQGRVTVEWAWLEDVPGGGALPSANPSSTISTTTTVANTTTPVSTSTPTTTDSVSSTTVPTTSSAPPATTTTISTTETTAAPSSAPPSTTPATETPASGSPAVSSSETPVPSASETSDSGQSTSSNPPAPTNTN